VNKTDRQLLSEATKTQASDSVRIAQQEKLTARLIHEKKNATGEMVTEAVRRDVEEKEKAAINEHDSDGGI